MTEHDEQRPLTRRERRLLETAQQSPAPDAAEAPAAVPQEPEMASETVAEPSAEAVPAAPAAAPEVQISPYNEDGSPRTRREIRQLRDEALAALAAAEAAAPSEIVPEPQISAGSDPVVVEPVPEAPIESVVEAEPVIESVTEGPVDPMPDFDTLVAPPTEPFTVEELRAAEQAAVEPVPEAPDALDEIAEEQGEDAPKPKRRFWQRGSKGPVIADHQEEAREEPVVQAGESVDVAPIPEEIPEALPEVEVVEVDPGPVEGVIAVEAAPEEEPAKTEYSFPDIQPPEEWRSVFDESRTATAPSEADGSDFDDLISRAVAQEGAAASSNTSALIMPTHPEDTGGLAGPLGSTGELFVTGSIELPRSLSETGGHSALHDSISMEPVGVPESPESVPGIAPVAADGPTPVAAKAAVSARVPRDLPVMAEPGRESSKLPLILTIVGGGLLAAVAGLGVWGAMNGMFG